MTTLMMAKQEGGELKVNDGLLSLSLSFCLLGNRKELFFLPAAEPTGRRTQRGSYS